MKPPHIRNVINSTALKPQVKDRQQQCAMHGVKLNAIGISCLYLKNIAPFSKSFLQSCRVHYFSSEDSGTLTVLWKMQQPG